MAFMDHLAMATPTYLIYRDGEAHDLTAPLAFFPAKDSDDLFDALRAKYPYLKTHSERMRDAIIEFLMEERAGLLASPWTQATSGPSPLASTATSSPTFAELRTPSMDSTASSPPAIEGMTSVFSLTSAEQPKQRLRRKMTEAEKVEYRKRRIIKACDKCAKRKRKCTHNQQLQQSINETQGKLSKTTKRSSTLHTALTLDHSTAVVQDGVDFDDFTLLPDHSMLDYDNLFLPDDVNSFDMFSQDHPEPCYIDPRHLSQHPGTYASPSSHDSLQLLHTNSTGSPPLSTYSTGGQHLLSTSGLRVPDNSIASSPEQSTSSTHSLHLPSSNVSSQSRSSQGLASINHRSCAGVMGQPVQDLGVNRHNSLEGLDARQHGLRGLHGLDEAQGLHGLQELCGPQGLQGLPGLPGLSGLHGLHGLQRNIRPEKALPCCATRAIRDTLPVLDDLASSGELSKLRASPTTAVEQFSIQRLDAIDRCPSPSAELFRLRRSLSFGRGQRSSIQLVFNAAQHERRLQPPSCKNKLASRPQQDLTARTDLSDGYESTVLATQRYKEYQRIDRFWVRDHHGRSVASLVSLATSIMLLVVWWPFVAMACFSGSVMQKQISAATRLMRTAGLRPMPRYLTASGYV